MDKSYKTMIETNIEEIVGKTDFKNGNFDINEIKQHIKALTGAIPSIQVKWNSVPVANEDMLLNGQLKTKDIVEGLKIVWMDDENKPHELTYLI